MDHEYYIQDISIHAPHTRGDLRNSLNPAMFLYFNPRPSYEGRLQLFILGLRRFLISIHAPHTRGDAHRKCNRERGDDFNPRPSYEGRR